MPRRCTNQAHSKCSNTAFIDLFCRLKTSFQAVVPSQAALGWYLTHPTGKDKNREAYPNIAKS